MIDTHAHLDFARFNKDREEVIKRAFDSGIEKIINVGCNLKSSKDSVELIEDYENIYATVGVHPHDVGELEEKDLELLKALAQNKKVVAVGEIGLDYFKSSTPKDMQKKWFATQIDLAQELNLPMVVHCRDSHKDVKKILAEKKYSKGVFHCFSGNLADAQYYISLGLYISFTGVITYTTEYDEVIKNIPLECILLETDCPFLAPVPHRGKRNEPAFVKYTAKKIAEIREISLKKVSDITTQNTEELFNLK